MAKGKGKKGAKKKRVALRRNRAKPARDKNWTQQFKEHQFKEVDTVDSEQVRAKGELSRKRTVTEGQEAVLTAGQRTGTVLAMRGLIAEVDDGQRVWPCTIRRVLRTRKIDERQMVTVGDHVTFTVIADKEGVESEGVIESVGPRHGRLQRKYRDSVQTLVANVDQVLIVASVAEPFLKPHLIDRYLVSAHAGEIDPIICFNKIDLLDPEGYREEADLYERLGYPVLLTSVKTGQRIETLRAALTDKKSALVGQSGVGKSSLLNAIQPGLRLRVQEVSRDSEKGRHTTTTARLLRLDAGGYVVDTPGIRSYELASVPLNELEMHFVEFVDRLAGCKFPDCTHTHETNCAIRQAVQAGNIHTQRYESYVSMFSEYKNPYA